MECYINRACVSGLIMNPVSCMYILKRRGKVDNERKECPECGAWMEYHEWPCVDPVTGDHLGNYCLWECPECGYIYDEG